MKTIDQLINIIENSICSLNDPIMSLEGSYNDQFYNFLLTGLTDLEELLKSDSTILLNNPNNYHITHQFIMRWIMLDIDTILNLIPGFKQEDHYGSLEYFGMKLIIKTIQVKIMQSKEFYTLDYDYILRATRELLIEIIPVLVKFLMDNREVLIEIQNGVPRQVKSLIHNQIYALVIPKGQNDFD